MEKERISTMFHVQNQHDLEKYLRDPKHRVQVWHHIAIYGVRFCLYVVAKKGQIMRVALVDVAETARQKYMKAMTLLWTTYMQPFEKVATIPTEMRTADLGFVETFENLQFVIAYRAGLRSLVRREGVLPPAEHVLDIMIALWNKTKGGTDQYSRAMEDLHGKWENFLRPTPRLTVRAIKTCFFQAKNAFCLLNVASSLLRGETKSYRQHLANLNRVITLRGFIANCTNVIGEFILSPTSRCPSHIVEDAPSYKATKE
jgi:hypothetical protein